MLGPDRWGFFSPRPPSPHFLCGSDLQPQLLGVIRAQVQQEELLAEVVLELLQVPGLGSAQGLLPAPAGDDGLICEACPTGPVHSLPGAAHTPALSPALAPVCASPTLTNRLTWLTLIASGSRLKNRAFAFAESSVRWHVWATGTGGCPWRNGRAAEGDRQGYRGNSASLPNVPLRPSSLYPSGFCLFVCFLTFI